MKHSIVYASSYIIVVFLLLLEALVNLFIISLSLDESLAPIVLQLLQAAASGEYSIEQKKIDGETISKDKAIHAAKENRCRLLVKSLLETANDNLLLSFLKKFLLQCNQTKIRWQAHSLFNSLYKLG